MSLDELNWTDFLLLLKRIAEAVEKLTSRETSYNKIDELKDILMDILTIMGQNINIHEWCESKKKRLLSI